MRECGIEGVFTGKPIACNLEVGHGGVHALRVAKLRNEATTIGKEVRVDQPTTTYETICTWATGSPAVAHAIQR